MVDETALAAAVSAGIKEAGGAPAPSPTPDPAADAGGGDNGDQGTGSDAPDASANGAGEGAGEGGGEAGDAGGESGTGDDGKAGAGSADGDAAGGEGDAGGDGAGAGEDGAGKAGAADAGAGKKPDATDPVSGEAKKEGDDGYDAVLDAPLPNALKPATKERIRTLVTRVKETEGQRDGALRNFDELYTAIETTGATPQQYAETLTVLRLVNSGRRDLMEKALEIKMAEIADLSKVLGIPVAGVNLLEGHQDLIDDVAGGKLTLVRANEIAAARHSATRARERAQGDTRISNEQRQRQAAIQDGIRGLNALGEALAKDPDYARKAEIVKKQLKPVLKTIHPSRWVDTFKNAYDALPALPKPAPKPGTPAGKGAPANAPVRGGAPAGGQAKAPSSIEEAVRAGLKQAGGG